MKIKTFRKNTWFFLLFSQKYYFGLSASADVDLVCHLSRKVMLHHLDGIFNRGLVRVACALSNNTNIKDPDAHRGRKFVRAGYTQMPSIWEGEPHKNQC